MKIEVETQPQSVATLRIELPPEEVRKEWDAIAASYAKYARIPGYRQGKAPKPVIEKKFRKEIEEELTKKLVSKSYHEAIAEKQLRVVSLTNLEDVEFGDDRSMRFRATVVTAPEFELPDYKAIPVQVPPAEVKPAEVDAALEQLREQGADFVDAEERPLAMEDFAVIDFEGVVDGVPIAELAPDASKNLQGGKKFWLRLAPDNFLPNFCEQLAGMSKGETRSVQVDFPAEFPVTTLAGKKADYAVTLNEVKTRVLPELDDAFAAKLVAGEIARGPAPYAGAQPRARERTRGRAGQGIGRDPLSAREDQFRFPAGFVEERNPPGLERTSASQPRARGAG